MFEKVPPATVRERGLVTSTSGLAANVIAIYTRLGSPGCMRKHTRRPDMRAAVAQGVVAIPLCHRLLKATSLMSITATLGVTCAFQRWAACHIMGSQTHSSQTNSRNYILHVNERKKKIHLGICTVCCHPCLRPVLLLLLAICICDVSRLLLSVVRNFLALLHQRVRL